MSLGVGRAGPTERAPPDQDYVRGKSACGSRRRGDPRRTVPRVLQGQCGGAGLAAGGGRRGQRQEGCCAGASGNCRDFIFIVDREATASFEKSAMPFSRTCLLGIEVGRQGENPGRQLQVPGQSRRQDGGLGHVAAMGMS